MEYTISARGLAKSFRGREVIRDCTLEIKRGEVYGFLGENGAGKTTVFPGLLWPAQLAWLVLLMIAAVPGALCTRDLFRRVETMEV